MYSVQCKQTDLKTFYVRTIIILWYIPSGNEKYVASHWLIAQCPALCLQYSLGSIVFFFWGGGGAFLMRGIPV
jgi:hypothetical protein